MNTRADRFDNILDECIDRILLEGDTVEACLARYPEMSAELEPYLRTVAFTAQASQVMPSLQAKERGRQRLQAEIRDLESRDRARENQSQRWAWPRFGLQPQWAAAVAAILLVVLIGGASTVAASGGALPSETLYPVKKAVEQVRLGLQPAPAKKADLHLAYAQRRSQEMASLIQQGSVAHLEATQQDLALHVAAASAIARSLDNDEALAALKPRIEASASESLSTLQAAIQQSPEESREAARTSYRLSSQAYGNAVEDLAVQTLGQFAANGTGTVQVRAMDPPPPGVDKLLIQVSGIEIHRASGDADAWIPIATEPQTFDLLRIATVQQFLGEQTVEAGTYTQVRFTIEGATVEVNGVAFSAAVPSGTLKLTRPFRVEEGKTTVVLLDFDGERSLVVIGQRGYILRPVVSILAEEPGQPQPSAQGGKEEQGSKGKEGGTSEKPSGRGSGEPKAARVELHGRIEALTTDSLMVQGKLVQLTGDTSLPDMLLLKKGTPVVVEATVGEDGALVAIAIEALGQGAEGEATPHASPEPPQEKDKPQGQAPEDKSGNTDGHQGQPPGDQEPPKPTSVSFTGTLEALSPGQWTVGGFTVIISSDTKVEGGVSVGAQVRVKGKQGANGEITAEVIVTVSNPSPPPQESPGEPPSEETPTPDNRQTPPSLTTLKGTLEQITPAQWMVDGQRVLVTPETTISGTPALGVKVTVQGVWENGVLRALSISIEAQ